MKPEEYKKLIESSGQDRALNELDRALYELLVLLRERRVQLSEMVDG